MLRLTRSLASSLAIFLVVSAMAPAADASLGRLFHLHPAATQSKDARITVQVVNHSALFRDVKVDGHVYTLMPRHGLSITAPAGTAVYAASTGFGYRTGELLLSVTPETRGATVYLN